jgi:hypothetical protein
MRRDEILQHVETLMDVREALQELRDSETVTPVKTRLRDTVEELKRAELLLKESSFILLGAEAQASNQ